METRSRSSITWRHDGTRHTALLDRSAVDEMMELVVRGFEVGGVAILIVGSLAACINAALSYGRVAGMHAYEGARRNVGRAILPGLEFLIIAYIVMTITVDLTLESAAALGLIVLVRTSLDFSLEIELEGSLPWRRRAADSHGNGAPSAGRTDA